MDWWGKEILRAPIPFTCRIWSLYMSDGIYEESETIPCNVCDILFSVGEDSFRTIVMYENFWMLKNILINLKLEKL